MNISTPQVVAMAATVGLGYFLYTKGQSLVGSTSQNPTLDGLDPNWPGGKPVGIDSPVNVHDVVPSCQIWDPQIQLFVKTHDPSWSESKERCFTNAVGTSAPVVQDYRKLLRYVDVNGKIYFNMENPLQTDPDQYGTCYFKDQNTNKLFSFPGFAPVNGSDRLCFAAGVKVDDAGLIFRNKTSGHITYNPALDLQQIRTLLSINPDFSWASPGDVDNVIALPNTGTYCEELKIIPDAQRSQVWAHTKDSAAFDSDVNACTNNKYRFIDPARNAIVYQNPETGQLITRNLDNQL